jgi:hypothetical protein
MRSISDRSRAGAIWPCLLVLAGALLPLQPTIADEAAFHDGQADRQGWEAWFGGLSGAFRQGAEFWTGRRSDHKPPDCAATQDVAFQAGCEEAKNRLTESDRRRHTEADYKAGWNSPFDAGGGAAALPASARPSAQNGVELTCMNGDRFTVNTSFPNRTTTLGSADSGITIDGPRSSSGTMKCVGENQWSGGNMSLMSHYRSYNPKADYIVVWGEIATVGSANWTCTSPVVITCNLPPSHQPLAVAPTIATAEAAGKPPPACVAIYFQPLPPGTAAGDHQVGVYESPTARLEVYGSGNGVGAVEYYMVVGGKRIQDMDAPGSMTTKSGYRLPAAAAKCVAAKRMPKPEYRTTPSLRGAPASCDGQGLIVVVARAGDQRLALFYGDSFGRWQFCSAAAF